MLGHITFSISFVVVIVRGRLAAIGPQYEEAARDLGANRLQAMRLVLLPLLGPAIFASLMVVFAGSIDDFVISSFLSTGAASETVPMKIYSGGRATATPALNALATIMLVFTLAAVGLAALVMRGMRDAPRWRRGRPTRQPRRRRLTAHPARLVARHGQGVETAKVRMTTGSVGQHTDRARWQVGVDGLALRAAQR